MTLCISYPLTSVPKGPICIRVSGRKPWEIPLKASPPIPTPNLAIIYTLYALRN